MRAMPGKRIPHSGVAALVLLKMARTQLRRHPFSSSWGEGSCGGGRSVCAGVPGFAEPPLLPAITANSVLDPRRGT